MQRIAKEEKEEIFPFPKKNPLFFFLLETPRELGIDQAKCLPLHDPPGVNFVNILHTAFTRTNPKSVK